MFKLNDYISIKPDERLKNLDESEKKVLLDEFSTRKSKKGLFITYDLSHSGRRINNRIYTTKGQQDGIHSILHPYPKPILQHHDKDKDPIGRFVSAEWEDLSSEAMKFFNNVNDFMEVKEAYDSDSPERIYKAMKKHNLLTNKNWPGLGRMRVKAQITDKDAIQKFLDGRYITFSAGSTTNRHVCSICDSDWAKGDMCEHRHGKIYDGEVCVFITGNFNVMEGSVVNMPADDLSQLQSMEFISEDKLKDFSLSDFKIESSGIEIIDSFYSLEETNMKKDEAAKEVVESDDSQVKAQEESLEDRIIEKVSKMITERFSEVLSKLKENKDEEEKKESEKEQQTVESKDEQTDEKQKEENSNGPSVGGVQAVVQNETSSEKAIGDTDGDIAKVIEKELVFDWYLLEAGLVYELGDKALSEEERKELSDSVFCGPERSFPIADEAHFNAANKVVEKANLSDAQKQQILSQIKDALSNVKAKKDFSKEIDSLKEEIKELREKLSEGENKDEKETATEVVVENPSIASTDESSSTEVKKISELGTYEKNFIKDYTKILEKDGEIEANNFYFVKSRYLKKGFDPKKYI